MKNFTNNFKQFTSRLSARWLIMALTLLLGTSSAWGDNAGLVDVSFWFSTGSKENLALSGVKSESLGTNLTTAPKLTKSIIETWKDGGNICGAKLYVSYDNGSTKELGSMYYSGENGNNQWWNWVGEENFPSTSGDHTVKLWISVTGDKSGGGCKDNEFWASNGGDNYTFTYNIAEQCDIVDDSRIRIEIENPGYTPNIWAWTGGTNLSGKSWPGEQMTLNDGKYIYEIARNEINTSNKVSVKFSNNGGNETGETYNLEWGKVYEFNSSGVKQGEDCLLPACSTPDSPLIDESDTTCPNVNYTLPTATNKGTYTQKWYKSNETEVTSTTVNVSTQTTYTTKLIDGTCESAPTEFTLNVTSKPATPVIVIGDENICAGEETYISVSSPLEGYTYKLYKNNTEVNGATLNNENKFIISEEGSYTVKVTAPQTACGLTSDPSQAKTLTVTSVTLELNPTSAPVCSSATIADISTYVTATTTVTPSGTASVNWYASEDATTALTDETELEAKIYYAEAETTSGCKSARQSFEVASLMNAPSAPVIKANKYAVCSGESVELTLEYNIVGEKYTINDSEVFANQSITWTSPTLDSKTEYIVTATNSCGSTDSEKLTINVTTTPVITGVTVTTPNKPVTLTSSVENTVWSCTGGSLSSNEGKTVDFTASSTGEYIITAKNKDNENCSASVTVYVRESLYYIYIRRPKNGETDTNYDAYELWYEYSNDDQKGGASWFEEGEAGSDIGSNDAEGKNDPNYGGYAPEFSFEDCNDYIWDAFAPANLTTNYKFHIHAPNGSGSSGHATFTKTTTISSMTSDLYYKIKKWDGSSQGVQLTQVTGNNIPTPRPEVATPIISMEPIICSGTNATVEITNPQNGVTYTLTYNGETQGDPISYNGSNEVKFSVNQAGTYIVNAETTEGTCKGSATSRGENLQIITTTVSFSQSEYTTTPWIPVTVKINVPKGYSYTYTDTDITSITPAENAPIKKVNGTEITYTFPRPNAEGTVDPWGIGNTTGDGWGEKTYQVKATIIGAPDACNSATATVKLQDEGNDKCTTTNP